LPWNRFEEENEDEEEEEEKGLDDGDEEEEKGLDEDDEEEEDEDCPVFSLERSFFFLRERGFFRCCLKPFLGPFFWLFPPFAALFGVAFPILSSFSSDSNTRQETMRHKHSKQKKDRRKTNKKLFLFLLLLFCFVLFSLFFC